MRYYFDTSDGAAFFPDDEGVELASLDAARAAAARALAEMAREVLQGREHHTLAIEVRDASGRAVLATSLTFEARVLGES